MTPETDKKLLFAGIRKIGLAIPLMFIGPVIINSSFKNQSHPFYYPILGLGILLCAFAVFWFFKGLLNMVSGFFNDKHHT